MITQNRLEVPSNVKFHLSFIDYTFFDITALFYLKRPSRKLVMFADFLL